ncbi:hypothetical protein BX600DRAFT_499156 [Xylariales sp. PMI_506]|nr:hypothetical protein BX600DRAFT_499156 [Xylariales sp. PMI_506]
MVPGGTDQSSPSSKESSESLNYTRQSNASTNGLVLPERTYLSLRGGCATGQIAPVRRTGSSTFDEPQVKRKRCSGENSPNRKVRWQERTAASIKDSGDLKSLYACPFAKRDPEQFLCTGHRRICDVRQHIKRYHLEKVHCPNCAKIFPDDANHEERNAHIASKSCMAKEFSFLGATKEQVDKMGCAAGQGDGEVERWYMIWDILFTGIEHPESPYTSGTHTRSSPALQHLITTANLFRDLGQVQSCIKERYNEEPDSVRDILAAFGDFLLDRLVRFASEKDRKPKPRGSGRQSTNKKPIQRAPTSNPTAAPPTTHISSSPLGNAPVTPISPIAGTIPAYTSVAGSRRARTSSSGATRPIWSQLGGDAIMPSPVAAGGFQHAHFMHTQPWLSLSSMTGNLNYTSQHNHNSIISNSLYAPAHLPPTPFPAAGSSADWIASSHSSHLALDDESINPVYLIHGTFGADRLTNNTRDSWVLLDPKPAPPNSPGGQG